MIVNDDLTRLFSTAEEELFAYSNKYNLFILFLTKRETIGTPNGKTVVTIQQ